MRLAATLLTMILLAGCIGGGDDPVEAAAADADAAGQAAASPAPAPAAPAASASSSAAAKPADPDANATPVAPVSVPYSWSSSLPPEVCAPVAVLGCAGLLAREGWYDMPATSGTFLHAKLDLSWTADTTGVQQMRFALFRAKPCEGDGCWEGEPIQEVIGASPLAIDADVPALGADEFLVVAARSASIVPDPAYGFAHTDQAFEVQGTFTVQS